MALHIREAATKRMSETPYKGVIYGCLITSRVLRNKQDPVSIRPLQQANLVMQLPVMSVINITSNKPQSGVISISGVAEA